jgi:hypothetical protein
MNLPNIFSKEVSDQMIQRINTLKSSTPALWGKMSVDQMLAHCNVTYEMTFEDKHPKPNFFIGFILKTIVKKKVVTDAPYSKNGQTAPAFIIKGNRDFEAEKTRLIQYIQKAVTLGAPSFEGRVSHSFGALSKEEWNNMFYKHLNHHLSQFGV